MTLFTNLPYKLQKEIITAVIYVYNLTFYTLNNQKLLYELFHTYVFDKEEVFRQKKLQLYYLTVFRYKNCVLINSKSNSLYCHKLQKLDFKTYIDICISYK